MSKKKEIVVVIPNDLTEVSAIAVKLCELFIAKVLDAPEKTIDINVDGKSKLVSANSMAIKELINLYLKSNQLPLFFNQLKLLMCIDKAFSEPVIKLIVDGEIRYIKTHVFSGLPDLHLQIGKL